MLHTHLPPNSDSSDLSQPPSFLFGIVELTYCCYILTIEDEMQCLAWLIVSTTLAARRLIEVPLYENK
jgi:hypothetical protein